MPEIRFKLEPALYDRFVREATEANLEIGQLMRQILRERYQSHAPSESYLYLDHRDPDTTEEWRERCKERAIPFVSMRVQKAYKGSQWVYLEIDLAGTNLVFTVELLKAIRMVLKDSPIATMRTDTKGKWLCGHRIEVPGSREALCRIAELLKSQG